MMFGKCVLYVHSQDLCNYSSVVRSIKSRASFARFHNFSNSPMAAASPADAPPVTAPFAHVRIKRARLTAFVSVDIEGGATGETLLVEAARVLCITPDRLRLLRIQRHQGFVLLDDRSTLSDQQVGNDDVIAAAVQDDDGTWDTPAVSLLQE